MCNLKKNLLGEDNLAIPPLNSLLCCVHVTILEICNILQLCMLMLFVAIVNIVVITVLHSMNDFPFIVHNKVFP